MQPKDLNISFIDFRILNMSFAVNPHFVERNESVEINPSVSIARDFKEGKKDFWVRIKVSLTTGDIPFFIDVESLGHFSFNEIPDTSLIERTSMINCPAIMFPYVRETIADLTRRAGFAPLHLQPINFVKLAERQATTPQKAIPEKKRTVRKK